MVIPRRLLLGALLVSAMSLAIGVVTELVRFGPSDQTAAARIERDVRRIVDDRTADLRMVGKRVAAEGALVDAAARDRERVPALFNLLADVVATSDEHDVSVTVYAPSPGSVAFDPVAWSGGPGEDSPSTQRLAGPESLFVAPGHAGIRLVSVVPVEARGERVATVVTETVLAPNDRIGDSPERQIPTALGPVTVIEQYASSRDDLSMLNGFSVDDADGVPLLEVIFAPGDLAARRSTFRRRALGLSILPLVAALLVAVPSTLRRQSHRREARVVRRIISACVRLILAAAGLGLFIAIARVPTSGQLALLAPLLLGLTVVAPGLWWWTPRRRRSASQAPLRFVLEQLAAGIVIAGGLEGAARLLAAWITRDTLGHWQFTLFPFDVEAAIGLVSLLFLEIALVWAVASVTAVLAGRWTVTRQPGAAAVALVLWTLPVVGLLTWSPSAAHGVRPAAWVVVVGLVVFLPAAQRLRRVYRRTTQSSRLALGLLALTAPPVLLYPMSALTFDHAVRSVIADDYAPAVADHPRELLSQLTRARQDIDRLATLPDLVAAVAPGTPRPAGPAGDSGPAYLVWSQTTLRRTRVISDVELFSPDGTLVSRFAFNLPEYVYRATTERWQASGCEWDVFGEVMPFGADSRLMLHAMRGVCDADGQIRGGIVIHVASNDYQALPFVASADPYRDLLGAEDAGTLERPPDLQVVVYGWSAQPIFTSGPVAWAVPAELFDRLYDPGAPFWTTLVSGERTYEVHFSQNRIGVYALGYPRPTWFDHAARLAEIVALTAVLFVVLQVGAVLSAPFTPRSASPLGQVFREVRTSFYRKLFLILVGVAVGPVLIFAVAFGSYMTARFRADVESEARTTVSVARRVFEELAAADTRAATPSPQPDDVMSWIRQVIGQDVNLFDGPNLAATSQRDLFDSGLLPARTPADVYRLIALERLPLAVVEDRVGDFTYLVAAAPLPARGRDAILTVPLAPRQREIEREADELNRGVLVGSVLLVLLAAALGASLASRIADPVGRLTRATRRIAAGDLDVRLDSNTADEFGRLVGDFNSMARTLGSQRDALARAHQLKAWNEMARQVAHEIKNPLTPIQLAAEHLQHVHEDRQRPLGAVMDQCLRTILGQVRLLRRIASEFANFAGEPVPRPEPVALAPLVQSIVDPYQHGLAERVTFDVRLTTDLPAVLVDRTLVARALTNLVENAVQAMPSGGTLRVAAEVEGDRLRVTIADTGVGMDETALSRAFDPYFSTKTGGSGLGLANARRNLETTGGTITIDSAPGAGTIVTVSLPVAAPGGPAGDSSAIR